MKPSILVARAIFPQVLERLRQHFDVEDNPNDDTFSPAQLQDRLKDKDGLFATMSERIDPQLLAACPRLKAVANMAVGYNNIDVLGMGRIGQAIARRSTGFGMQVIYHNRSRLAPELEAAANNARYVGREELLQQADHIVLVMPYSPALHHTIGEAEIALMKPTAILVNIARGGIVDDAALIRALRERRIAGAGLDVYENEPAFNPDFLTLANVVLTPHIASASIATRLAMANCAADNLIAALSQQEPPNLLNPAVRAGA
jgi:lactate dehydrogenase-like 2-hydroxyacid dehydrogenase